MSGTRAAAKLARMTVLGRRRRLFLLALFALLLQAFAPVWAAAAAHTVLPAQPAQSDAPTGAGGGCDGHHLHGARHAHGCCDRGGGCLSLAGCSCAAPCAAIAVTAASAIAAPSPADASFSPVPFVLAQAHAAPPLRPPLA